MRPFRLGLIVNPVAGMGGRVGLKGTDGLSDAARKLGAEPVSEARTLRALRRLGAARGGIAVLAAGGAMGAAAAAEAGLLCQVVAQPAGDETTATDTANAVRALTGAPILSMTYLAARANLSALDRSNCDWPFLLRIACT